MGTAISCGRPGTAGSRLHYCRGRLPCAPGNIRKSWRLGRFLLRTRGHRTHLASLERWVRCSLFAPSGCASSERDPVPAPSANVDERPKPRVGGASEFTAANAIHLSVELVAHFHGTALPRSHNTHRVAPRLARW